MGFVPCLFTWMFQFYTDAFPDFSSLRVTKSSDYEGQGHLSQIWAEIWLRGIKVNTFTYKVAKQKQGVTARGFPVSHSEAPVQTGIELRSSFFLNREQKITSIPTGEFINPGVQDWRAGSKRRTRPWNTRCGSFTFTCTDTCTERQREWLSTLLVFSGFPKDTVFSKLDVKSLKANYFLSDVIDCKCFRTLMKIFHWNHMQKSLLFTRPHASGKTL